MKSKDFLIHQLNALLITPGSITSLDREIDKTWQLINFLIQNNLVTSKLKTREKVDLNHDFRLMRSDLTDEGFKVLQVGLGNWHDRNDDIRKTVFTVKPLENALKKVRGS